eukprot:g5225.t1
MATTAAAAGGSGEGSGGILELKTAQEVVDFWFGKDLARLAADKEYGEAYGAKWFGFGPPDEAFIGTQNASKELIGRAASGELGGEDWDGPNGALAKLLLLDQFPRTAYRGTAQAFENDEKAATLSLEVIAKGWDTMDAGHYTMEQRHFVYMPLMHSEKIEAQDVCVSKIQTLFEEQTAQGKGNAMLPAFAKDHRSVVARFGRFPHRNAPLGRESTPEEVEWLKSDDVPGWAKSQAAPTPP